MGWTDQANEISERIGELANCYSGLDYKWAAIESGPSRLKRFARIVERSNTPVRHLTRPTSGNLAVRRMKAEPGRSDLDVSEVFISKCRGDSQEYCVPFGGGAHRWDEHENVVERFEHETGA